MEWDVGLPWYRPTRVCHVVSGGEFGWRNGSGKWPKYYPDSLPPVCEIGPGSPTGITFGTGAKFPARFQNALFISDWSYGIIYALTMKPSGASWTATAERFCWSNALPVTDLTINPTNGAMYFLIGGRRSQSALYEITYSGNESTEPATDFPALTDLHLQRQKLESFHQPTSDPEVVRELKKALSHSDRHIRYAARIGLEHQNKETWARNWSDDMNAMEILESSIALSRTASDSDEAYNQIVSSLNSLDWPMLDQTQRLHLLRSYGLAIIRFKKCDDEMKSGISKLESYFPSGDIELDRELSKLLIAADLDDSQTVAKTVRLLLASETQEEQVAYAWHLAAADNGWTPELQQKYFTWFLDSSNFLGGHSFGGYISNIRKMAVARLSEEDKARLGDLITRVPERRDPYADLKARDVVKNWTVEDILPVTDAELQSRDIENGKKMFAVGSCYKCHRISGQGGRVGPELTAAGNRFNTKDLLTTLVEPSKSISDQYSATVFAMEDGDTIVGRVVNLAGDEYWVQSDMVDPDTMVKIKVKEIEEMKESSISPMPAGLLDTMTRDDILDLIAYMRSTK
jgi:putative heme-binding domain-containing protein